MRRITYGEYTLHYSDVSCFISYDGFNLPSYDPRRDAEYILNIIAILWHLGVT